MKRGHPGRNDVEEFFVPSVTHGLLWTHKLKATKPRLQIFELLSKENVPISIADISKRFDANMAKSTIFRILETFREAGFVTKVKSPFNDRSLYEFSSNRSHHHHATCISCGTIEDIVDCEQYKVNAAACLQLKKFKSIQSHSLEFFGLCKKCEDKTTE